MMLGKGSLAELERLKAEHAEEFRAAAPKYRPIDQECFDLFCPHAIGQIGLGGDRKLHTQRKTCKIQRCPKERQR